MKTKPIVWDGTIAFIGNRFIGQYTMPEKATRGFFVKFLTGNYGHVKSESEARAWVENQFIDFIKEISEA